MRDLRSFASAARPVGKTLAEVLVSFRRNDGIERLMDYIFFQATAVNGFDSFGHYLRAGLIVNQCSSYAVDPTGGCSANFRQQASATTAGAASMPRDPVLAWTARMLAGLDPKKPPKQAREKDGRKRDRELRRARQAPARRRRHAPPPRLPDGARRDGDARARDRAVAAGAGAAARRGPGADGHAGAPDGGGDPGVPLLDYLFGGDG